MMFHHLGGRSCGNGCSPSSSSRRLFMRNRNHQARAEALRRAAQYRRRSMYWLQSSRVTTLRSLSISRVCWGRSGRRISLGSRLGRRTRWATSTSARARRPISNTRACRPYCRGMLCEMKEARNTVYKLLRRKCGRHRGLDRFRHLCRPGRAGQASAPRASATTVPCMPIGSRCRP